MRNGNFFLHCLVQPHNLVLILPMRNGNLDFFKSCLNVKKFLSYLWGMETFSPVFSVNPNISRSYPTYEEWKLGWACQVSWPCYGRFLSYLWGMETILLQPCPQPIQPFLSYLWGMETHFHHHCCYHKFFLVLILPMRNGNFSSNAIPTRDALFLSYLWGMETIFLFLLVLPYILRSYPTYEEWKLWSLI